MHFKALRLGALCTAVLAVTPAFAQEELQAERQGTKWDFSAKGGPASYSGDLGRVTGLGVMFGLQADAHLLELLSVEAGAEFGRAPVVDIEGGLWRYNVSGLAKLGPTLAESTRPFVGVGVGLSLLDPTSDAEDLYDNDIVAELPVAVGVEYRWRDILAGARASYHFLGGESLDANLDGDYYQASITLGGRF